VILCALCGHARSTQVSLLPPPCEEFTTSDPRRSATRVKPSGHQRDVFAIENVRAQIDVARLHFAFEESRARAKAQRGLGDIVSRLGQDPAPEVFLLASVLCGPISIP
jgi:hypothetical protein